MVDVSELGLNEALVNKLKQCNVTIVTEEVSKATKLVLEGKDIVYEAKDNMLPILSTQIKKIEDLKKLKVNRTPRAIIINKDKESVENISNQISSLLTKEIVIAQCHEGISKKKTKKMFSSAVDIVVATPSSLQQILSSETLNIKNIKSLFIIDLMDIYIDENINKIDSIIEKLNVPSLNGSLNESSDKINKIQLVVIVENITVGVLTFMKKYTNAYESIQNSNSIETSTDSDESESEDENVSESEVIESKCDKNNVESNTDETDSKEIVEYDIDQELMKNILNAADYDKYHEMSKLLLEKFSDIDAISRVISLIKNNTINKSNGKTKKSQQGHSGSGSKFSGRDGYTAYLFTVNRECFSKSYLYKSLKRLIEEDVVEQLERVQMSKDKLKFVFDLPSSLDEIFQSSWSDGKFDQMCLLEGEIPELEEYSDNGRGSQRGGFDRGRGGRGGFDRGRGGRGGFDRGGRVGFDRGGRGGYDRGGRGFTRGRGDRGGYKRPGSEVVGNNVKIQKLD